MKKIYTLLFALMVTGLGFSQTTLFDEAGGGSAPTGWTFENNVTSNVIDRGSYWLVDSGNPSDFIITDSFDLSSFTDAEFTLDVATFGSGGNNSAKIEISFDGGSSYTQTETSNTPSSSSYINGGTITLNSVSNQVVIRISNNGTSGRGVRLRDLVLTASGVAVGCTAPSQASSFATSTVNTTDATFNITRGGGNDVLIVMREGSAVNTDPTSGTSYTANSIFADAGASEIGTGNFVIFNGNNGTSNPGVGGANLSVSVSGLTPDTTYHVAVYEYNTTGICYNDTEMTGNFTTATATTVQFQSTSTSVAETVGTYDLVIEIANENAVATTFDVVLTSGSAADINSYTTQSESFPGSSTTDVTVTITVTDDAITEADEVFTFEIQNVAGGNSAVVGTNTSFDLTILANDAPTSGTLYDADFSNDGDGFPAHTSSSPPAAGPASVGPFGSAFNQWTLSYNTTPSTDGSDNTFEVVGGALQSRDWGGQGIFTSQVINVSGVSSVDISATGLDVDANQDEFTYFYILDGGSRVETNVSSGNGDPVNYSVVGLDVSSASTLQVGFEFSENGGDQGYDVSEFIVTAGCTTPTTQASAYNTTSLGSTSATLNWTSGDGDEVLVIVKEGSAVDADPSNGTSYTGNTAFTSGDQIGTGNYAVLSGTTTNTVSVTGLNSATTYYVAVYEYNTTDTCYLIPALTGSFTTGCSTPDDVSAFTTSADNATVDLSWTNESCFDDILVVAKAGSAVTVIPTGDGTAYTADAAFASGTDLGTSEYAVYKGTGTSLTVTGLTNGTTYYFTVFARKDTTWSTGVSDFATPNLVEEAVVGDLIITEVSGDGTDSNSSNDNGYMEIYNRSNKIINLDNVEARYFNSNPGNSTQQVTLSGTLSPGAFVIVSQDGGNYTTEYSDTADATGSDFFFNGGDDGCDVYHTTNGIIDQFNDNGNGQSPWNWNDNFTYKRNSSDSGAIESNWTADGTNNTPRTKTNLYFWTGGSDTSWANAANWDEGSAPSITTDVVITDQTNEPLISASVEVANFTIETSTDVAVEKTGNLEVSGNLNNNGSLSLDSDSNEYSSLIIDGTSNGTISYNRHVNINGSGTTGNNDLISAPLTGQTFDTFQNENANILSNTGATLFLFGPFDKTIGDYVTYADGETATLDPGVGYRAASTDNGTFTFTGIANNGTVALDIENSGPQEEEWNLIGNPYPSYINVQDFLNHEVSSGVTNLDLLNAPTAAIYGYDGDALNGWTVYNLATTTASTVIAPGQGFFVSADATNAPLYDIEFTPEMRTTGTEDDFIAGRAGTLTYFTLLASTASDSYDTDVYFNPNATLGFNFGFDAELFSNPPFVLYTELVEINSGSDPTMLALQAINTTDLADTTIPIGINASQGVQVTFSITENTLPASTELYLDDTVAGTSTLLNNSDYVFTPSTALSGTGRFYLRVFDETLSTVENTLDTLSVFALNNTKEIVVKGQLQEDTALSIYDIQGRHVLSAQLDHSTLDNRIDTSALSGGVYVVTIKNGTQQKSQKVIIK